MARRVGESRRSFRTLVRDRLLQDLQDAMEGQTGAKKGNTVLVVDTFTLDVINSCLSRTDIVGAGFFTVCPLEEKAELAKGLRRRAYPSLDALYLMRQKKPNLQRVLEDFKDDSPPHNPDWLERLFPCIFSGIQKAEVRVVPPAVPACARARPGAPARSPSHVDTPQ